MKAENASLNLEPFRNMLEDAQRVYRKDVAYAVAVSNAARAIQTKRAVWKLRLELRAAAKEAKMQCKKSTQFICKTVEPCGTGTCKFAHGELTLIELSEAPGSTERPQRDSTGPYSLETALAPLSALRVDN